jgi:MoaA/NifB/PqqE/SkfB family radical SAM enzyme
VTLPYLSPYLRPFLRDGALVVDNGITSRAEQLTPLQERVLGALWDRARGEEALAALIDELDDDEPVLDALAQLGQAAMLFESEAACEAFFDQVLDTTLPAIPFVDQVEITNICPMKCGFCPRGIEGRMARGTGLMSPALFAHLLDQMHPQQAAYRPLELHHLGESLVHPEVDRFVALATARGLPTELSVNPSHLRPELARRLLDAGLRRIVVSLDGMDGETLAAIRGPAARFDRAEANLAALLSMVAASADPPRVVIQMIDLHRNRHQRAAFLERYADTGLPTVTAFVKDLDGPDPDLGRPTARPLQYLCSYPYRSVVVLWDGRVVACCRDDDGHLVLGDLTRQGLREIWDGEAARRLRAQHRAGSFPEGHLCDGCGWRRARFKDDMPSRHPRGAQVHPLQW